MVDAAREGFLVLASDILLKNFVGTSLEEIKNVKAQVWGDIKKIDALGEDFSQCIEEALQNDPSHAKRLVVFVDDLDRCLPEQCVEVFESIKLFLNSRWCIFVIGMNKEQICKAFDIKFGVGFKTRKTGTINQVGQVFPTGNNLPLHERIQTKFNRARSPLQKSALAETQKMVDGGFSGFTLGIRFRDGHTQMLPIVARDYHDFISKAGGKIQSIEPNEVQEIAVVSGGKLDVKNVFHKIGTGASRAASMIQKGAQKAGVAAAKTSRGIEKISEKAGQLASFPEKLKQAYYLGYAKELGKSKVELEEEMKNRPSERQSLPIKDRIDRLIKRKMSSSVSPWALNRSKAEVARLRQLSAEVYALDKTCSEYGGVGVPFADKVCINRRVSEIEREITALGGKI